MRYTTLGHSGIEVSRLCLGGMSFGEASPDFHQWTIGPDDTRAVIARALDQGINFIDTANCYSFGTSEEYIGRITAELEMSEGRWSAPADAGEPCGTPGFHKAADVLAREFGVQRMATVGSDNINAAFLDAGLLDEVSVLIGPGIDARGGMAPTFDGLPMDREPLQLELKSVQSYGDGAVWIRYNVK